MDIKLARCASSPLSVTASQPISADKVVGGSLGYPWLLDPYRRQLVFEAGGRKRASSEIDDDAAIGGRFQQAIGRRLILRVDAFASAQEDRDEGFGVRSELQVRF